MLEPGQRVTQVNANKMTKIKIKVGSNYLQNINNLGKAVKPP